MALFAMGDTHLSLGTDKPMDKFPGWENYVSRIEANWKKLVTPEDTVVIPGDISWAMSLEGTRPDFQFLNELPGTKLIGKGNHDYWWSTMNKMNAFLETQGFETLHFLHNNAYVVGNYAICATRGWFFDDETPHSEKVIRRECGRLRMGIEAAIATGKEPLVFLHYPPVTNERECTPIMDVLRETGISTCYYAHLHGNAISRAFRGERDGIQFDLISADSMNFCPRLISR